MMKLRSIYFECMLCLLFLGCSSDSSNEEAGSGTGGQAEFMSTSGQSGSTESSSAVAETGAVAGADYEAAGTASANTAVDAAAADQTSATAKDASAVNNNPDAAADAADAGTASSNEDAALDAAAANKGVDGAISANDVTGTVGTTPLLPIKTALVAGSPWVSLEGETIIYLLSDDVTCDQISNLVWLMQLPSTTQAVEIILPSDLTTGTFNIVSGGPLAGGSEVNYAVGGGFFPSASASSGTIEITASTPQGPIEGTLDNVTFDNGGSLSGSFHAEYCPNGQAMGD